MITPAQTLARSDVGGSGRRGIGSLRGQKGVLRRVRDHELRFAALALIVAVGAGTAGARVTSTFLQSLLVSLATTFLGLAIALTIVNVYLERESRRNAVRAIARLIAPSLSDHHNALLEQAWLRMGKDRFGELIHKYLTNQRDPLALAPEERHAIYQIYKENKTAFEPLLAKMQLELQEVGSIIGWSFDPDILADAFDCRYAISKLRAQELDDTPESESAVCEQFLDTDWSAHSVLIALARIARVNVTQ